MKLLNELNLKISSNENRNIGYNFTGIEFCYIWAGIPISILLKASKVHERCLYVQAATYFEYVFSMYISFLYINAVFARIIVFNTASYDWKIGKKYWWWGVFGALLTDLSKAFDCVLHDLIIAELQAYGFHIDALKLIHDYWSNIKQRVNYAYRSWKDIFYGVPQGSVFYRLLFSMHLCDLFYFLEYLDKRKDQSSVH